MLNEEQKQKLTCTAYEMRRDILDLCHQCGTQKGHLGGCLSAVELLAVLYLEIMNISSEEIRNARWEDRDRFVMSKGHAGIALYAALHQADILTSEQMRAGIRGENTILFRHPKYNPAYGIECSVGSLGLGIGYAVGLVEAMRRKRKSYRVYVMLGDGECNEGAVWESLAYASHRHMEELTVIIDKNNLQLDGETKDVLNMEKLEDKIRAFGFTTCTIDGHDFDQIYNAFQINHAGKPLAIIARTVKGKGISFAENKTEWHDNILTDQLYKQAVYELNQVYAGTSGMRSVRPNRADKHLLKETGLILKSAVCTDLSTGNLPEMDYKNVVGTAAKLIADQDTAFSLVYADCANRISIEGLRERHPEMCYEMGIAEQNQIMVAAALAQEGFHVFAVAYAPFITARVLDQIRTSLGYMKCPVKLIGLAAGFAASDLGATHTALEDISNMRSIPNMTVIVPADCQETAKAMLCTARWNGPVYIRVTNELNGARVIADGTDFKVGKATILHEGKDVAVIGCGTVLSEVMEAVKQVETYGNISCKVLNMHTIKPLDECAIQELKDMRLIVTVEEHSILGGLGGAVAEYLASQKSHAPLLRLGVPDQYYKADIPKNEMRKAGLLSERIAASILERIDPSKYSCCSIFEEDYK